eukprot:CAMPEP_0117446738 /NCGR_PEP_ID=MMETSP0759-20121206/6503_1 /TAXON_ID=63605 /ORGANISM="Percolomonas cosmopolitus, Strain WS" /LENGTH=511 /DNA_ID=CAMNT_0005239029 /DNA_START=224 /DNA_END=1759 /DNA_ORIENTATION=-
MAQILFALHSMHEMGLIHRDIKPENVLLDEDLVGTATSTQRISASPEASSSLCYRNKFTEIGYVKLCDFGSVAFIDEYTPNTQKMTPYVATRWYRAPELLTGAKGGVYSPKVDVWAAGCLMAELLDGEPLFAGKNDVDQLYKIQEVCGPLSEEQKEMIGVNIKFVGEYPANTDGIPLNEEDSLENRFGRRLKDDSGMDFLLGCLKIDPQERFSALKCLQHPWLRDVVEDFGWKDMRSGGREETDILEEDHGQHSADDDSHSPPTNPVFIPSESFVDASSNIPKEEPLIDDAPSPTLASKFFSSEHMDAEKSLAELQNELEQDTISAPSPVTVVPPEQMHVFGHQSNSPVRKVKRKSHKGGSARNPTHIADSWNVFGADGDNKSPTPTEDNFSHLTGKEKDSLLVRLSEENKGLRMDNAKLRGEIDRLKGLTSDVAGETPVNGTRPVQQTSKNAKSLESEEVIRNHSGNYDPVNTFSHTQKGATQHGSASGSGDSPKASATAQHGSSGCSIM